MTPYTLSFLLLFAWIAFAIPTGIVLLRSFRRTQMSGFLWLLGALTAWPLLARGVSLAMPLLTGGLPPHGLFGIQYLSIYTLIFIIETLVGGALLLTAVVTLDRQLAARMVPPATPPPNSLP